MRLACAVLISILALALSAGDADAVRRTKGYVTKQGTYVAPHYSSTPNRTRQDNYSTRGNTNPYTGKRGYKDPYAPKKRYRKP